MDWTEFVGAASNLMMTSYHPATHDYNDPRRDGLQTRSLSTWQAADKRRARWDELPGCADRLLLLSVRSFVGCRPRAFVGQGRRPLWLSAPFLRHGDSPSPEDRCPRLPGQSRWVWQLGRPFGPTVLPATWSQFPWHTPMISILGCEGHLVSPGWPGLRFGAGLRNNHLHDCHDRFFTNPRDALSRLLLCKERRAWLHNPIFLVPQKSVRLVRVDSYVCGGWGCRKFFMLGLRMVLPIMTQLCLSLIESCLPKGT